MSENGRLDTSRLRKFGLVMAVAFGLVGGLAVWRGHGWGEYLWYVGGAFLALGLVFPRALGPIERGWMAFAEVLGRIVTTVILTLTYFLVMTPMGLLMRLLGKDLLELERKPEGESYWVPVERDGPASRAETPY